MVIAARSVADGGRKGDLGSREVAAGKILSQDESSSGIAVDFVEGVISTGSESCKSGRVLSACQPLFLSVVLLLDRPHRVSDKL